MDLDQYTQYYGIKQAEDENKEKQKVENLKVRLSEFGNIKTIEEAKELAKKILPVANELNRFRVGNAKCVVVNKPTLFRICLDTEDEFIAYDFVE